ADPAYRWVLALSTGDHVAGAGQRTGLGARHDHRRRRFSCRRTTTIPGLVALHDGYRQLRRPTTGIRHRRSGRPGLRRTRRERIGIRRRRHLLEMAAEAMI